MQSSIRVLAALALLAVCADQAFARKGHRPAAGDACPADVVAAFDDACPCDAASNHGAHVSCVVRLAAALRKAGCPNDGLKSFVRCARRSTCGRAGAVRCCVGTRARVARDDASCADAGGESVGTGSLCSACNGMGTVTTDPPTTLPPTTTTTSSTTSTSTSTLPVSSVFGNFVEFAEASATSPGYLVTVPIVVPQASTLTHLAMIAKAGGPQTMLALYADDGAGMPGQLVAFTALTSVTAGPLEVPVSPVAIPAGTYWIGSVFDQGASVGLDESDFDAPVAYLPLSCGQQPPATFAAGDEYVGQRFNYYVRVQ